jgi:hypothetical protein
MLSIAFEVEEGFWEEISGMVGVTGEVEVIGPSELSVGL